MDAVESLPARPLTDAELAVLNRAEPVTLAVAVADDPAPDDAGEQTEPLGDSDDESESGDAFGSNDSAESADDPSPGTDDGDDPPAESTEGADGILVATETAVTGLALVDGGWTVVDRLSYGDGMKRYDALRSAESTVRHALR